MTPDPKLFEVYGPIQADLMDKAPAQGRMLRYFMLAHPEMREVERILDDLDLKEANFRLLIGKMRGRGIEIVCTRTAAAGTKNEDVRYLYGLASSRVENWADTRKTAVLTAWHRAQEVFIQHLRALDIDPEQRGRIIGKLEAVEDALKAIHLGAAQKVREAQERERAREAEAAAVADEELVEA